MTQIIKDFFHSTFGFAPWLAVMLLAMVPVIELKGSIPFGRSAEIWGDKALGLFDSFFYSFIGCFIITVVVILLLMPILKWLKKWPLFKRFALWLEGMFKEKSAKFDKTQAEANQDCSGARKFWTVAILVSIPLPGAGVWTGAAVAVFLEMKFWPSVTAVTIGNFVSAFIVSVLVEVLAVSEMTIFYAFLIIAVTITIFLIIYGIVKNRKKFRANAVETK